MQAVSLYRLRKRAFCLYPCDMAETPAPVADNKSPTYRLVTERVGKDTVDWLRDQRNRELSWRAISLDLWARHNLDVTEVTLRKWWNDAHPEPVTTDA